MKKRISAIYYYQVYDTNKRKQHLYIIQMQGNISYLIRIKEYISYMIRIALLYDEKRISAML